MPSHATHYTSRRTGVGARVGAILTAATMALAACGGFGSAGSTSSANEISAAPIERDDLTDGVPLEIRGRGQLIIATNAPYAPLEFFEEDGKTLIGFDIDLGNALARALDLRVRWKNVAFDSIIPGVRSGRYDLGIAGFSIQKDRLAEVDFVSYYVNGGGYLVKSGGGVRVNDYGLGLCGLRVAVQSGTDFVKDLEKARKRCVARGDTPVTVMRFADQDAAVRALRAGRVDAVLGDKPQVEWVALNSDRKLCVTGTFRTTTSVAGIAIPKGTPGFTEEVQKALTEVIRSGEYRDIAWKWGVMDGMVTEAQVFTRPDQVEESDEIFPDPYTANCA